jgi:hypothetical protein
MLLAAAAGLATGLVHVLSGPDHLAAVAPMAAAANGAAPTSPTRGWRTGLQWGLGHSAGVLLIGLLLLLMRERLPIDLISGYSERLVGAALVLVGVWGAWRALQMGRGWHSHAHGPAGGSFAMGTLHGLAGSSHVFGIVPALAFATRAEALSYLGAFGLGAVCGMTMFAAAVGLVSTRIDQRRAGASRGFLYGCSAAAVIVGGVWLAG